MNQSFDQKIRDAIREEDIPVPKRIHQRTEALLASLPEKEVKQTKPRINFRPVRRIAAAAACFLFVMLVVLPNVSVAYAQAVENIPIIGDLVKIFTIRNYFYSDERHELEANIPEINDFHNEEISNLINKDVSELTGEIIDKFYHDLEISNNAGYGSVHIDYETVMNTEKWFTMKLTVSEVQASSNTYFRFYHIDRTRGTYVRFGDLFAEKDFDVIENLIRAQMKIEMTENPDIIYWLEETDLGKSITAISSDQNFYFDEFGNLVIVYNQYDVGPGFMGCPEIVLSKDDIEQYLVFNYEA